MLRNTSTPFPKQLESRYRHVNGGRGDAREEIVARAASPDAPTGVHRPLDKERLPKGDVWYGIDTN